MCLKNMCNSTYKKQTCNVLLKCNSVLKHSYEKRVTSIITVQRTSVRNKYVITKGLVSGLSFIPEYIRNPFNTSLYELARFRNWNIYGTRHYSIT